MYDGRAPMRTWGRLFRAGVVVNDAPTLGELAKDQGEGAMRLLAIGHRHLPFTIDVGRISAKKVDGLNPTHGKLPHLVPGILVPLTIAVQSFLPPLRYFGIRHESQLT